MRLILAALFCMIITTGHPQTESAPRQESQNRRLSLAERLGFNAQDRILIVNGDDAGMSHAANLATIDCLENGLMTSATIMMPCPWVPEIAAYAREYPRADFGLHLTHTSEWKKYRWGPVASRKEVLGLLDPEGYLWSNVAAIYRNATPEQAETEARAQIRLAIAMGIDVTHLDSHMGALQYDLRYFEVYLKLAREFDLPIRMASQDVLEANGGGHLRPQLEKDGILCPDYLIHGQRKQGEPIRDYWKRILSDLKPGVTELYIHAALATEEMKEITGSWSDRAAEHELFTTDKEVREILERQSVKRIGYRPIRDLQRQLRQSATVKDK